MVIKCLECNYKCGLPFTLAFHYSISHQDEIIKCACGDGLLVLVLIQIVILI